jgi:hypothetical protein
MGENFTSLPDTPADEVLREMVNLEGLPDPYLNEGKDYYLELKNRVKERFPEMNRYEIEAYIIGLVLLTVLPPLETDDLGVYSVTKYKDGTYGMGSDSSFGDWTSGDTLAEAVARIP